MPARPSHYHLPPDLVLLPLHAMLPPASSCMLYLCLPACCHCVVWWTWTACPPPQDLTPATMCDLQTAGQTDRQETRKRRDSWFYHQPLHCAGPFWGLWAVPATCPTPATCCAWFQWPAYHLPACAFYHRHTDYLTHALRDLPPPTCLLPLYAASPTWTDCHCLPATAWDVG